MVRARIAEETRGTACARGAKGADEAVGGAGTVRLDDASAPRTARTTASRCAGVVPQQPPTMRTPKVCTNSRIASAIGAGSSGYTASPVPVFRGSPALGMQLMGRVACSVR